ncbi:MAG: carboxypeptidase regulatory-like domain-containing protein, partial [Chloroflexi bacterium]|nr:carboxypeptidase regulatory-like domain-containing protein [Chloroflexota bacterium]
TIGGDAGGYTTYSVQFCPPAGQSLYNPIVTDTLPTGATFISGTNSPVYNAGPPSKVVWSYPAVTLVAPACRNETITVQYPTSNFAVGQIVTNTIDVTHQPTGQPNPIPVGTKNSPITLINNTGTVTKTLKSGGVIGGNTIYTVTLQSGSGQVLVNPIMTDTLPIGATFVTASGTYTHTGGSPDTVIWSYAGVISATKSETITVQYATPPFTSGEVVTNTVDLAHQPPGEPPTPLGTAIRPVTLTGTNAVVTKTKTIGGDAGGYTTYSVQFCPSTGQSLYNPVVTDTLPTGATFISGTNSPVYNAGPPSTVVWSYAAVTLVAPACRNETIVVQYPVSNFAVGQVVTNTIDVTHQPTGQPNPIPVGSTNRPITLTNTSWTITKTNTGGGTVNANTSYTVTLCPPSSPVLGLINPIITDTLPTGATFISGTNSPVYNAGPPATATWSYPGTINTCQNETITLLYLSSTFTGGQVVTNTVDVTGQPVGQSNPITIGNAIKPITLLGANSTSTNSKGVSASPILVGATGYYTLTARNTGNTPLDNFTIVDNSIPTSVTITSFTTGNNSAGKSVNISYTTNTSGGYINTNLTAAQANNITITIASLGLAPGVYITGLRWNYGTVPVGFNLTTAARINFSLLNPDPTGAIVNSATITNCETLSWSAGGVANNEAATQNCRPLNITGLVSHPSPLKSLAPNSSGNVFLPGNTFTYTLQVQNNTGGATPGPMINPILVDLLPPSLSFVTYTLSTGGMPVTTTAATVFENLPNYTNGQTLLRWQWPGISIPTNVSMTVNLVVQLSPTMAGTISNTMYLASPGTTSCTTPDTNNLTGYGVGVLPLCGSTNSSAAVSSIASLNAKKLVKGQLDSSYGPHGLSIPGGTGSYRLVITNTGSVSVTNIQIIDIMPYVGDTGVKDTVGLRGTQWRPFLLNQVTASPGITVYYSIESNPCRPEISPTNGAPGCLPANWSTTPPADITTVQSLKFDYGSFILNPGENLTLGWPFGIPTTAIPTQLAWNSFAYVGTPFGSTLLPSEPPKVDIQVQTPVGSSLGDYVWHDLNNDGIQDTGELGVPGITVTLYSSAGLPISTTLTDLTGYYNFPGLSAGTYSVGFELPPGYNFSPALQGGNTARDSNPNVFTGHTAPIVLGTNENNPTIDAGIFIPASNGLASLGDFVWYDTNQNGIQDAGETGVPGATVTLYDITNSPIATTTTDATGHYLFTNLTPGTYSVGFTPPAGYILTTPLQGANTALDSNPDVTTGRSASVTLAAGQHDPTIDAGIYTSNGLASLGDYVWNDANHDGIQDATETGMSGITVTLFSSTGVPISTTHTNASGYYSFTNLTPGTYTVGFTAPPGYAFSPAVSGTNTAIDSNPNVTTGRTAPVTLIIGENNPTIDAGLYQSNALASLGDFVWYDTNKNGIQDAGETGVVSVTVTLYDGAGAVLGTTTTDGTGFYQFTNLTPGQYSVGFTAPAGYIFSPANQGGNPALDSNPDNTGRTANVTLVGGQHDPTIDAGIYPSTGLASLGDYVWNDANHDGIQDATETGIVSVTVTLYDVTGTPISTTITDGTGHYQFANLTPGTYSVGFTAPPGYAFSPALSGTNTSID